MRALWVPRWDITTPSACDRLIEVASEFAFDTLFVQVRGRGDAFYSSSYEPRSEMLDGQDPDFDPLGRILERARQAGIAIHAWLNANFTWESPTLPRSSEHIVNKHPDWLMRTLDGRVTLEPEEQTEGAYACPSSDEFRAFLREVFMDVASNYPADGIHFDFIRYPSPKYCYCKRCLRLFGDSPAREPEAWDEFRRRQITELMYGVRDAVKSARPDVTILAAVFGDSGDAYNHRYQDWKRWLTDGRLDIICPMAYSQETSTFAAQIADAVAASQGIPVCAGIGAWRIAPESTAEKIVRARELGAAGFCLFSYSITNAGKDTHYLEASRELS